MTPAPDPALRRVLAAAGLPTTGRYTAGAGWVSQGWVGDELVVRTKKSKVVALTITDLGPALGGAGELELAHLG